MARDGPIYGNQVANLINEKTNGAWKPSAGSIYPALNRLTRRGLIERYDESGKAMYKLTEKGSSLVKKIGERHLDSSPMAKLVFSLIRFATWFPYIGPSQCSCLVQNR